MTRHCAVQRDRDIQTTVASGVTCVKAPSHERSPCIPESTLHITHRFPILLAQHYPLNTIHPHSEHETQVTGKEPAKMK